MPNSPYTDDESETLPRVCYTSNHLYACNYIYVSLYNVVYHVLVDSGSDVCVIKQSVFDELCRSGNVLSVHKSRYSRISTANGKIEHILVR